MIDRYERIAKKLGKDKAVEMAQSYLCSLTLGRDFNETVEAFYIRRPDLFLLNKQLTAWIKKQEIDK